MFCLLHAETADICTDIVTLVNISEVRSVARGLVRTRPGLMPSTTGRKKEGVGEEMK